MSAFRSGFRSFKHRLGAGYSRVPLLGWLLGALMAAVLEQLFGAPLAVALGLPKIPALFGCLVVLKRPILIPSILFYLLLIYVLPIGVIARQTSSLANKAAGRLYDLSIVASVVIHLGLLYAVLHVWSGISDYRVLTLRLTLIAVMVTLSLNVINGYMGDFSCSHPGFMAL
ncbi:MAG: branched-chain amino acid ABC transporter permease, partial [Deltaproteobacteria bacterium]|nr:branched-chain amino acid ABC transporter permease [Deltaproteobacteria bacterium]